MTTVAVAAGLSGSAAAQEKKRHMQAKKQQNLQAAVEEINVLNQPLRGGFVDGFEGFSEKGAADTAKAVVGGGLWIAVVLAIFVIDVGMAILPAMLAAKCNPKHPIMMGLVGFFFSEIYLFQFLLRKLVIKEPGYCKNC